MHAHLSDLVSPFHAAHDDPRLIDRLARGHCVLIGEATHGTHEFYRERAEITKRLIAERGFCAVAVEADWPDAYRVNRFVRGVGEDQDADEALSGFQRFPTWMWRNEDVLDFVEWLQDHNANRGAEAPAGFYGLDLYSLNRSMAAVLEYLDRVDPEGARRARSRYSCFDHFGEDTQTYGYAASFDLSRSCEQEVVRQLVDLQARAADYASRDGRIARDEYFYAEQNARLVANAEGYYRAMFQSNVASWNLRDAHMVETLTALEDHLAAEGLEPRVVVWAHNSHIGDARATDMGDAGEWSVGQLVKQRHGPDAALVGMTTYEGTVTAASDWDGPASHERVRPALPESYEATFHGIGLPRFWVDLAEGSAGAEALAAPRLERAIGVVYRPETERASHYFRSRLPRQFDVVLHFDRTRAVEPLERTAEWTSASAEMPETFPTAL